jgi:hypothetical protein
VSSVVALAEALVDVVVKSSASEGDVLEIDGTPRGQAAGDFGPVGFFLVASIGIATVAIFTAEAFLTVNGQTSFLMIVVELLGGDEEVGIAVAFDAGVCHLGCSFLFARKSFCDEQLGERQRDHQESRAS